MEKPLIQNYISNFRRLFSGHLKPNVSMQSTVHPFEKGAVIVFDLGFDMSTKDEFRANVNNITEALSRTNLFERDNNNTIVKGTNIILIKNKIVIIKDNDESEWSEAKASDDIQKLFEILKNKSNGKD